MGEFKIAPLSDYGDGDGGDYESASIVTIKEVENGYIVDETYEDGDSVYVYSSPEELIDHLKALYGVA